MWSAVDAGRGRPAGALRLAGRADVGSAGASVARALLGAGHPARDAALQLVTELVTNSVRHSRSARPGGWVHVSALVSGERVEVVVRDQGSTERVPTVGRPGPYSTGGRGLALVEQLADEWDWRDTDDGGRLVWFVVGEDADADAGAQ